MRVAIYSRASINDVPSSIDQQIQHMKAIILRNGWKTVKVYRDLFTMPGSDLPEHRQMLLDAKQHCFDILFFWTLEQLSHQNARRTMLLLDKLHRLGIGFCSYTEPHLDSCHDLKEVVPSVIATLMHQDSIYIGQKTRIGLQRQRKTQTRGPHGRLGPGRPDANFDQDLAKSLRLKKYSYADIAVNCGVSTSTIFRFFHTKVSGKKQKGTT
jgi:DNA invertase Pin-like site-specific DNA recombinase